jgi:O-succinylbenzoate synthase
MKWRNTRIYQVSLPLLKPILVRGEEQFTRDILRIEQETWDGRKAYAECSPLPTVHQETLAECLEAAKEYLALPAFANTELPVSLKTALEILEWQLEMPELKLFPDAFENSALVKVPLEKDQAEVIDSLSAARVIKVKIGMSDLGSARRFLEALAGARSDRELRLDCNQAFESRGLDEVKQLIDGLPVSYLEEPFADLAKLKAIAKLMPIALDESLGRDAELDSLAAAWVIKPNCLSWEKTLALFAHSGPQQKILSNCFESLSTLQLYAWAYRHFVKHPKPCGLGTAFYMAHEVEAGSWNAKTYLADWPYEAIADYSERGDLVWES